MTTEPGIAYATEAPTGFKVRVITAWRQLLSKFHRNDPKKSNLYFHAKQELKAAGYFEPDDEDVGLGMNAMMAENVLELIEVFCKQGHSGFSASFAVGLFETLAKYQPLGALTGKDFEWNDMTEYGVADGVVKCYQNNRCSHVFKEVYPDGTSKAYDIDAIVYREPSGACFTKGGARNWIEFPYTPSKTYIDVPEETEEVPA